MKLKRGSKIAWFAMIVVMVSVMLIPMTIALAETPTVTGVVSDTAGYVLGDTYQRHSWYSDGRHWAMWSNDSAIVYSSSLDGQTWAAPAQFKTHFCNYSPPSTCCNGSDFSLWYNVGLDRVDVAYLNISGQNENLWYQRGRPEADGTIAWNNPQIAVNASANMTYMHPSICDNTDDYPFIAYMAYNFSSMIYEGHVDTSITNDSTWTFATNSSANIFNWTTTLLHIYYPSVIPITNGNVSAQYVIDGIGGAVLGQNYAYYNLSSDIWVNDGAQYPLPVTSILLPEKLWYHSEVSATSTNNSDDVYMVARVNDSVVGNILWYDRYGDTGSPWVDDIAISLYDYIPTLSIRNALGNIVMTAINTSNLTAIYSDDYTQATQSWGSLALVDATNMQGEYIMSSYDNNNADVVSYQWLDNGVPFNLDNGCYGCAPITNTTDPGTTIMQIIIPLLVAITVVILALKGIGEINTVNAIVILMIATFVGVITFFVIKQLVLGI